MPPLLVVEQPASEIHILNQVLGLEQGRLLVSLSVLQGNQVN